MRIYSNLRDESSRSLSIGAELVYMKDGIDYEIEIDPSETFIRSIELADYVNNQYKAALTVSIAIRINSPEYVSMRFDGEIELDDENEVMIPIREILIYDTTIPYSNPEVCEEVYSAIGDPGYLNIEVTCK